LRGDLEVCYISENCHINTPLTPLKRGIFDENQQPLNRVYRNSANRELAWNNLSFLEQFGFIKKILCRLYSGNILVLP
ncbi:MAG: hypothetical protein WA063_02640, partial [Minisyncoccia bacterium]